MVETVKLAAGGLEIPTRISREGKKICLVFRNFEPLKQEIKAMRGAEFKHPPRWLVTDCERNWRNLQILQGGPDPFEVYSRDPVPVKPRRKNLRAHQVPVLSWLMHVPGAILNAEMGTGKTLPTIEAMEQVGGDWWYVAPKKVLLSVQIEFKKWDAQIEPKWVSYHMLRKELEKHKGKAPRGVVFDESAYLKSHDSAWTDAAQYLADNIRKEWGDQGKVFLLSGMCDPKDPVDLWSQAEIACPGFLRESSAEKLRQRLIKVTKVGETAAGHRFPEEWEWKPDEVAALGRRLVGLVYTLKSEDCQDLPDLVEEFLECEPAPDLVRAARLAANTSESAMQALNKCRQLSDGFIYDGDKVAERCPCPKDDLLEAHLAENEQVGRTLIYASYTDSIDRCVEICLKNGWNVLRCDGRGWATFIKGDNLPTKGQSHEEWLKNMDRTQDPGTVWPLALVGHAKSGGYGLNLTAARQGFVYSADFDYGSHAQMKKRGHREGMDKKRGFKLKYACNLPTDRYVLQNHEEKKSLQKLVLRDVIRVLS